MPSAVVPEDAKTLQSNGDYQKPDYVHSVSTIEKVRKLIMNSSAERFNKIVSARNRIIAVRCSEYLKSKALI